MTTTVQRIFLISTLGVGYYLYRNTLREVIYQNQNTFINSLLLSQLKSQNYTVVGQNRVLIGNPANRTYDPSRERVVILGGGIIGLSTAYYLAKLKKYDVILIEKNENFMQAPVEEHGAILSPSQSYPQTDADFFISGLKSIFTNDTPVKFSYRLLFERYFTIWFTNYLLNLRPQAKLQGCKKLAHLANLGMEELQTLNEELDLKEICDMTSKGTIQVYSSDNKKHEIEALKEAKISIKELDKDQLLQLEPALAAGLEKYKHGYIGTVDTDVNINALTNKLVQIAEINGVGLFTGTEFHRFLFQQENNKMIGVITSQGVILCDKVVIAGGIKTKDTAHKLGVRLPIIGFKQYTITTDMPENKKLSHNIYDDKTRSFVSPLKKKYLISGCADLGYDVEHINDERVQYLLNAAKMKIGEFENQQLDVWAHIRSLTSDDVPIIGALPKHENIYVNTGHGEKGLTLALGSGKVLADIMNNRAKKDVEADYSLDRFYLI